MACTQCNACARTFKIIVLLIAIMGLICGILGSFSCEFYSTDNGGDIRDALDSVGLSDLADVGQVQFGIFGYEGRNDQCIDYPNGTFNDQVDWDWFGLVQTSQINAAVSIAFGILGILLTLMELIICNFIGSCTFAMFSFFVAWATMAGAIGTFITGVVNSGFCTDSPCSFGGPGLGLCAWSIFCYFVVNCMMCCIPRPDAWLKGSEGKDANDDVAAIPAATANTARAEEEMTPVVTGIAPDPEAQVAEEVVVEAHA
ncbi:hypothetical protein FRACYDRAFT_241352 [Fragilariopsis cylindrus CCMP1102]|uniref:Uncharacterized protein n=1 Tax=Fragilariopsis cylindrus CCMP1102 TaxID=635003 RepID=A0A1E7F9G7_9STRA|nr:hypothetical protein FRACYDRAFT_241352 [Fragilariopsis cylindrus CCMP1102]|eukprot:OEU14797.1 hypothetical protein FRACYDRAFT_241352 [Fragilariopsis cylindrus CCMP1102]